MEGVQTAIDDVQRHDDRAPTCVRPRSSSRTGSIAVYLDDEGSDRFDIRNVDFGDPAFTAGRSTSPTTCSGTAVVSTSAAMPEARWAEQQARPGADRRCRSASRTRPSATSGRAFGSRSTGSTTDAGGTALGRHPLVGRRTRARTRTSSTSTARDRCRWPAVDFWTWYFIEDGWDYGYVEALVGGEWVTVPLYARRHHDRGHDRHGPARQQRRGQRAHRDLRRRVLRRRAGVHPPAERAAAGGHDRRAVPLLDRRGVPRHRLVRRRRDGRWPAATLSSEPGNWIETNGIQDNNWVVQLLSPCDLTPGVDVRGRDRRQRGQPRLPVRGRLHPRVGLRHDLPARHQGQRHRRHLEPHEWRHPGARRRLRLPAPRELGSRSGLTHTTH